MGPFYGGRAVGCGDVRVSDVVFPWEILQLLIQYQQNMSSEFTFIVTVIGYFFSFQLTLLSRAQTTFDVGNKTLNFEW